MLGRPLQLTKATACPALLLCLLRHASSTTPPCYTSQLCSTRHAHQSSTDHCQHQAVPTTHRTPCRRLLVLCEAALAAELSSAAEEDPEEAAELAPTLLAVADEQGLQQLRGAALAYCVEHYADVSASRAWCHLGPGQVGLVAREAAGQLKRVKALLSELSENSSVTLPSPRWF